MSVVFSFFPLQILFERHINFRVVLHLVESTFFKIIYIKNKLTIINFLPRILSLLLLVEATSKVTLMQMHLCKNMVETLV